MIATIAAFAEKKYSNRSGHNNYDHYDCYTYYYGNHSSAIIAITVTMVAEMRNISVYLKNHCNRWRVVSIINMIAELFFSSMIAVIIAIT